MKEIALALLLVAPTSFAGLPQNSAQKRVEKAPTSRVPMQKRPPAMSSEAFWKDVSAKLGKKKPMDGSLTSVARVTPRQPHTPGLIGFDVQFPIDYNTRTNEVQFQAYKASELGSLGIVRFVPPSTGRYLVVTTFTAYGKTRCRVFDPAGGMASANSNGSESTVANLWEAKTTNEAWFGISFFDDANQFGGGYWRSTEFFKL